jgi:hypothetical protein
MDDDFDQDPDEEDESPDDFKAVHKARGDLLRHDATPSEALRLLCEGRVEPGDIEEWADPRELRFFWALLVSPSDPDFGDYWSPRMAFNWIRFRDEDKVREISEKRLWIVGLWQRRSEPLSFPVDDIARAELADLVGRENLADLHEYRLHRDFAVQDENGRVPAKIKEAPVKTRTERDELWRGLAAGDISATGLKNGASPRVEIPAREWMDLRFGRDCESSIPGAKFARPDTLFAPDGQRYRRVLISANAVKAHWPAIEATASDVAAATMDHEAAMRRLDAALRAEANQNGGTVPQQKGIEIAREIARDAGVKISRAVIRERIKALKLDGKQGRRKNAP